MELLEITKGKALFNYGDRGEKFYILIAGSVRLSTPSPVELSDKKCSAAGILSFFVNFHDEIVWESFDRGNQLKYTFYDEVRNIGIKVED